MTSAAISGTVINIKPCHFEVLHKFSAVSCDCYQIWMKYLKKTNTNKGNMV